MSEHDATTTDVTIPIPEGALKTVHISVTDYINVAGSRADNLRARYQDDGKVTVWLGNTSISLSTPVWDLMFSAVSSVTPVEVTA